MTAPEKIWAWEYKGNTPWGEQKPDLNVVTNGAEYTRSDLIPNAAYVAGLEAARVRCKLEVENCRKHEAFDNAVAEHYFDGLQDAQIIISRLADEAREAAMQYLFDAGQAAERITALVDENERLVKALIAANWYLDRGLDKMAFNVTRAALSARPDAPDVRAVTVAQLARWAEEWANTCDAMEEDLRSVPFDRKYISEIRAIIGEPKE